MTSIEPTSERYDIGRAILLAVVAALGGFLFGFDTALINGAVLAIRETFRMGAGLTGFVVASVLLGCAVGAWLAGKLADRIGRIRVMVLAAALFLLSALGSGLAYSPYDLTFWRIVGGLGVGAASVIAPAYIAEIAPASIRGRLGSLQQLAIVSGIFVALLSDYFLATAAGGATGTLWFGLAAWRWMFISLAVPALAYGILALEIPESPRYLMFRGRIVEARAVLSQVLKSGVDDRIREISRTIVQDVQSTFQDLRGPFLGLLPIVWVGILLSVFQQFVGINVIFYYSSTLWQQVGFTEADSLIITVLTSVTNIVVTLVAIGMIDKVGRRRLLLIGSAGMFVSLATLAYVFGTAPVINGEPSLSASAGTVALIAANAFVVFFGISWGPAVWVLLGEMFNNRIRAAALGFAASAQWISNFLISTTFPVLAAVSLGLAYGLYTIFALLSLLFVWQFVPETKGKQLEDMGQQTDLNQAVTAAKAAAVATQPGRDGVGSVFTFADITGTSRYRSQPSARKNLEQRLAEKYAQLEREGIPDASTPGNSNDRMDRQVTREEEAGAEKNPPPGVSLPTPALAKQWEELGRETFERLMAEVEREQKHMRRMESAELCSRIFGQICAFGTVVVLALLARYFVDHDAATQGVSIIVTGAMSIVAVYLTSRLVSRR
jgi:sugar porter (SP) family MFS transporter